MTQLNGATIAVRYSAFAAISIVANIGAQKLSTTLYEGPYSLTLSILIGTAVGLLLKYVLDKTWIFRFRHRSAGHGLMVFSLYVAMGIVTTAIFWSMEFLFEYIFRTEVMRYAGAVLGLAIGYVTKYMLDKRFVFR